MVHGIVCITLFISGTFLVTKKLIEKKKIHPAVHGIISLPHQNGNQPQTLAQTLPQNLPQTLPQTIKNIQSNPNIDCNGKNINMLGDRSTICFICVIIIFTALIFLPHFYEGEMKNIIWKIMLLNPILFTSIIFPATFYVSKPEIIPMIKDIIL